MVDAYAEIFCTDNPLATFMQRILSEKSHGQLWLSIIYRDGGIATHALSYNSVHDSYVRGANVLA